VGADPLKPDSVDLENLRPELTRYCYRMLGSIFDADDAVQDTLMRAWQHWDQFDGQSSRRYWIYRIATHTCLDHLRRAKRRAMPMDISEATSPVVEPRDIRPGDAWVWPASDAALGLESVDPVERAVLQETIRLAFVAALQTLPPRQRAVLILRDVFGWTAKETGGLMGMSTAAVNSALQRARGSIARANLSADAVRDDTQHNELLDRYVDAFERFDIEGLVALFHEDATFSMPPFVMWVRSAADIRDFYRLTRHHCEGSRLIPVRVNGTQGFAQYAQSPYGGPPAPWGIHVPVVRTGKISHLHTFIDARLYARFGLPESLVEVGGPSAGAS
jgi:RNA polymerase sigma-70 factor (TIGR02960 family)